MLDFEGNSRKVTVLVKKSMLGQGASRPEQNCPCEVKQKKNFEGVTQNKSTLSMTPITLISVAGDKPKMSSVKHSSVLEHSVQAHIICCQQLRHTQDREDVEDGTGRYVTMFTSMCF